MSVQTIKRVGFVGLGLMGSRMARRLATQGFEVVVWNRTREKALALAGAGLQVADSAASVARACDAFCTCVADPAALGEVALGERGLFVGAHEGQLFIDFSTVSSELSLTLEARSRERGITYLEAPVTGSINGAESGRLLVMAGGTSEALERATPVLQAVSEKVIHCGPVGAGTQVKLAGNALIALMLQGLSEGMLLAQKAGVSPAKLLEVVQASGYRSPYYDFKGGALLRRDFDTHFAIDLMFKDLSLFLDSAGKHAVPTPTVAAVREAYQLARAHGQGGKDITAVITALEHLAGVQIGESLRPREFCGFT